MDNIPREVVKVEKSVENSTLRREVGSKRVNFPHFLKKCVKCM